MRRKRKVYYWVQDVGEVGRCFWWVPGRKWQRVIGRVPSGSSNIRNVRTLKAAFRTAEHLLQLGGVPLITQFTFRRGMLYRRLYWLRGTKPHPYYLR